MPDREEILIRLSPDLKRRFTQFASDRKVPKNTLVTKLIEELLDPKRAVIDQDSVLQSEFVQTTAEALLAAVVRELQKDKDWASEVVIESQLGLPGQSVFANRIHHFSREKDSIARQFAPWLLKRARHFIEKGHRVYLVIDSGTTMFWLFRALGAELSQDIKLVEALHEHNNNAKSRQLAILTNNLPGVEEFIRRCQTPYPFATNPLLSDIVKCHLLSGEVLPAYAAVTGPSTENDLKQSLNKGSESPSCKVLGLLVGNWLQLSEKQPPYPIPLARGLGHRELKQAVVERADEIYVLSPLCKVFQSISLDDFNGLLHELELPTAGNSHRYEAVAISPERAPQVKLVSTYRANPNSLVFNHSSIMRRMLHSNRYKTHADYMNFISNPIEEVPHLLYEFDDFSATKDSKQMAEEFPHEYTQDQKFLDIFAVGSGRRPESAK